MIDTPGTVQWGLPPPVLPHQFETFTSDAKITLQSGAYGSGKTNTNAWTVLYHAVKYPNNLVLMGAETIPQLRETLQGDFDTLIFDLMAQGLVTYTASARSYKFWNGSKVLAWALVGSNAKAMRHRIRSLNLGAAVIEEATGIPEATLLEVLGRLRRPNTARQMSLSCNPDSPEHYLYDWFVENPKANSRIVYSNTYNNPFLARDYISTLEDALGAELASRYLKGQWVKFEGLVYKDFRRKTFDGQPWHVIEPRPIEAVAQWAALDFGGANPHALLWFVEDAQGYIYVTHEWYKAQVGLDEVADAIKARPVTPIYRDHDVADALTLQTTYHITGLTPARKEKMPGIATVQQFLKPAGDGLPPRLRIFNTCPNLIRELGRYHWPEGTDARDPGNEPVKKDDHALDALRYGLHTRFFAVALAARHGRNHRG